MINQDPYIGQQIGNYRLVEKIACGSFGCVYRAEHTRLKNRTAAIKLLNAPLATREQQENFMQEADLMAMLEQPHVLHVLDAGMHNSFPYLITEYCPGGSLRDRIKRQASQPFPTEEALSILTQIAEALQFAHEQNIVHRDLKPENILFNVKGEALLADFGIAKMLDTIGVRQGTVIGTPAYMAPEQFRGLASRESDQYALGCIAYELFTGRKPFIAPDMAALMFKHLMEQPVAPRQVNAQLSEYIEQAVLKALAKEREDRHSNISTFINALNASFHQTTVPQNKQTSELQIKKVSWFRLFHSGNVLDEKSKIVDGKFKIVERLGESIFKLELLENPSSFYVLRPLSADFGAYPQKEIDEYFNKEIEFLSRFKHPQISSLRFCYEDELNHIYYLITEFIPGRNLAQILAENKGPLDEEQVIRWMMQFCKILADIHSCTPAVILNDIRPSDIMITPEGEVRLADIGVLRRNERVRYMRDMRPSHHARRLGVFAYASPEYWPLLIPWGGKRDQLFSIDLRSDIYSLGATMYTLLTNSEPDGLGIYVTDSIHTMNPRLRTVQVGNTVICPVEQVIIKAMQQDPMRRFQKAKAMRTALEQCLEFGVGA